jgi:AraC family transcriptional regulator
MKTETFASRVSILDDITKSDLDVSRCNNEVFISNLNYLEPYSYTSNFSIKYVYEGVEQYRVNGVNNKLLNGHCLIVNNESDVLAGCGTGKDKKEINLGMSVFLTPMIISEVFEAGKIWSKDILHEYPNTMAPVSFYDGVIKNDPFAETLKKHFLLLNYTKKIHDLDEGYYYGICEQLLQFQHNIFSTLCEIQKIKYSTRQEILKRVLLAKEIIDHNYLQGLNLNYLAKESSLSKYFLIRSFKQVFKVTPHKYHIQLKINKAKELLQHQTLSISEVASLLNYPNIFAFSKQFNLITGCAPSKFKEAYGNKRLSVSLQ